MRWAIAPQYLPSTALSGGIQQNADATWSLGEAPVAANRPRQRRCQPVTWKRRTSASSSSATSSSWQTSDSFELA